MPDRRDDARAQAARDWVAIWHSEAAALAADRELQEGWTALLGAWAAASATLADWLPDAPSGRSGPAAPARPAPAAAPADAGLAAARRLEARVAELERLLAGRDRGG